MKAATLIQALFRGYLTRKHINIMNYARDYDHSKFEDKLPTLMEISEEDDKTVNSQLSLKKDDTHLEEIQEKTEESIDDNKSFTEKSSIGKVENEEASTTSLLHSSELHDSLPLVEGNNQKTKLSKDDTLEETSSGLLHSGEFHDEAAAFNTELQKSFDKISNQNDKSEVEEGSMSSLQHSSELHDVVPLPSLDPTVEKEVKSKDSSEALQHSSEMHDSLPLKVCIDKTTDKLDSIDQKSVDDSISLIHSGEFHDIVPIEKENFTREMKATQESISDDLKAGLDENVETEIQKTKTGPQSLEKDEESKASTLQHSSELHDSLPFLDKKESTINQNEEEHSSASLMHSGEFHDFVPLPKDIIPNTKEEALTKQLTEDDVEDALEDLHKYSLPIDTPTPTNKGNNLKRSATVDEPPIEKKVAPTLVKSFSHCTEIPVDKSAKLKEIEEEYEDVRKEMEAIKNEMEKASEKSSSFDKMLEKDTETGEKEVNREEEKSNLVHGSELHDSTLIAEKKDDSTIKNDSDKIKEKNLIQEDAKSVSSLMHSGEFHDVMPFVEGIQKHVSGNEDDTSLDESSSILQSSDVPEVTTNKLYTKVEEKYESVPTRSGTSGKLEQNGKPKIEIEVQSASDEQVSSSDKKKSSGNANLLKIPIDEHDDLKVDNSKKMLPQIQKKESTDSENDAALKIQSNFRGYRVRRDLRRQGTEINLSTDSSKTESSKLSKDIPIHKGVMEYIDTITNPQISVDKPDERESLMHSGEFHDSAFSTKDYLTVKDDKDGDSDDESQRSDKSSKSSRRSSFSIKNCMKEVAKPFKEAISNFYDKKEEKSTNVEQENKEETKKVEVDKPTEMIYIPLRDYSTDDETMDTNRKVNDDDRISQDSLELEEPKKTTIHIYSSDKSKGPVEVSLDGEKKMDASHVATIHISSSNVLVDGQSKESHEKSVDSGHKSIDDEEKSMKTASVKEERKRKESVTSVGLMGSGEFHDVVPLGLMTDTICKDEGSKDKNTMTTRNEETTTTGNVVNQLPVQLPQSPGQVYVIIVSGRSLHHISFAL